jgi:cellulose synthase/poly-beta-1,6-N-acetylglucosamine synthase-like glycosyltransferase
MLIELLANIFLFLYFLVIIYLFFGARKGQSIPITGDEPFITVLIPAKDEEKNIVECLNAILKQNYPPDKFEVLLIDDQSEDSTVELSSSFKEKFVNFRVIRIDETFKRKLQGKTRVIDFGVQSAKHDIILMTDADCMPNPDWIRSHAEIYNDSVGMVAGVTILDESYGKSKLFSVLQSIDWIFLLASGSASSGFGKHISCIGSNISFRKEAYNEVGGYESLPFSITEDLLLFKTIANKTKWKVIFPLKKSILNISKPMQTFTDYYRQRKRWVLGSKDLNFMGAILLITALTAHFFAVFSLFNNLYQLLAVFTLDTFIVFYFLSALDLKKYNKYLPIYLGFYIVNVIMLLYVSIFDRTVIWKKRRYNQKGEVL